MGSAVEVDNPADTESVMGVDAPTDIESTDTPAGTESGMVTCPEGPVCVTAAGVSDTGGFGEADVAVTLAPLAEDCLLYTSPSPRDMYKSRMPSSA